MLLRLRKSRQQGRQICRDDGARFFNALGLFFSDLHLPGQFLSGATHARSGADAEILQQSSLLGKLPPCCSQLIPHPSQASFESAAFYTARSEEHTYALPSLIRLSYAVFRLIQNTHTITTVYDY